MSCPVDSKKVNDRIRLIRHRLIARMLVSDPELVDRARTSVRETIGSGRAIDAAHEWERLLGQRARIVRRAIVSRGETMDRLRMSSPLAAMLPLTDEAARDVSGARLVSASGMTKASWIEMVKLALFM